MRIAITVPHFSLDIGRNESGLGTGFAKLGHEACVITTDLGGGAPGGKAVRKRTEGLPYRVVVLPRLPLSSLNPIPVGIRSTLRDYAPDVVHSSEDTDFLTVLTFKAARNLGLPFVLSTERYYIPRFPKNAGYLFIERMWTKRIRREADAVTTHSTIQISYWLRRGLARADVEMIPVGVWTDMFSPGSSNLLRETLDLKDDTLLGFTVGRMTDYKDYPMMLRAMRAAVDNDPKVHLAVAGFGPDRGRIKRLARELRLGENVHFLEERVPHDRMPDAMRSADFYLQTSSVEPFGISVVEAMAAGRPVVATDVGGMSDTVVHHKVGYKVASGDAEDCAKRILELRDSGLRAKMGEAGRQRAVELYDWSVVCKSYLAAYERGIKVARGAEELRRGEAERKAMQARAGTPKPKSSRRWGEG